MNIRLTDWERAAAFEIFLMSIMMPRYQDGGLRLWNFLLVTDISSDHGHTP